MKHLLILLIFCSMLSVNTYADKKNPAFNAKHHAKTNILVGKVVSGAFGIPFASVTYYSGGHAYNKLTDEGGNFTLYNIDAANGLTASASGYVTKHVSVPSPSGGVLITLVAI